MFSAAMSNSTSNLSEEASVSSGNRVHDFGGIFIHNNNPVQVSTFSDHNNHSNINDPHDQQPQKIKKKRSLPGNPDPDAEVIALSPKTLLATNRFVCEICNKGFQRDQNLQLHRRGHNLPWKLKQRNSKEIKKRAYVCPEPTCVHHNPSRALGDLTGIKKHYCRKHGEKKWKCEKCSKIYAVQSDWKAHSKTCGTKEYRCDCGTLFSRKDSFITHRAFCDALAEESARLSAAGANPAVSIQPLFPFSTVHHHHNFANPPPPIHIWDPPPPPPPPPSHHNPNPSTTHHHHHHHHHQPPPLLHMIKPEAHHFAAPAPPPPLIFQDPPPPQPRAEAEPRKGLIASPFQALHVSSHSAATSPHLSATALLQKAATVGAVATGPAHHQGQYTQSVGHVTAFGRPVGRHVMNNDQFLLGRTGLTPGDLATWRKTDRLTRDFLGLTADGNSSNNNTIGRGDHGHSNLGNGAVNVSVNVKDMLTYAGGVEFVGPYDQRDHNSLLRPQQVFGFAEATSQTWADC